MTQKSPYFTNFKNSLEKNLKDFRAKKIYKNFRKNSGSKKNDKKNLKLQLSLEKIIKKIPSSKKYSEKILNKKKIHGKFQKNF